MTKIFQAITRPICSINGCMNQAKINGGKSSLGFTKFYKMCSSHIKKKRLERGGYLDNKELFCQICGFVAEHSCQLDIDHIDGNNKNNLKSNLQVICSNCHRLKTLGVTH